MILEDNSFQNIFEGLEMILESIRQEHLYAWEMLDLYLENITLDDADIDSILDETDMLWDEIDFHNMGCVNAHIKMFKYEKIWNYDSLRDGFIREMIHYIQYQYEECCDEVERAYQYLMDKDESCLEILKHNDMVQKMRQHGMFYKELLKHPKLNETLQDRCINDLLSRGEELPWFIHT